MELEGVFKDSVIVHAVLCLLFGLLGIGFSCFILRYYGKKTKLDQLSVIYSAQSIISLVLSLLLVLTFIFFFVGDMYFPFTLEGYTQSGAALFFTGLYKIVLMAGIRGSVMIQTLLVFLTANKVKWTLFKIRTRVLKAIIGGYPLLIAVLVAGNCIAQLRISSPFYVPWISRTEWLTVIYFWITLAIPGVVSLACVLFLLYTICFNPSALEDKPSTSRIGSVLATIKEEIGAVGGDAEIVAQTRTERLKTGITNAKGKVTDKTSKMSAKFDNRDVTRRTIFTIMSLVTIQVLVVTSICVVALSSIYSSDNILDYDIDNTESDYNLVFIYTVLAPLAFFCVINPVLLLIRVNGLRREIRKGVVPLFEPCAALWKRRQEPVDA